MRECRFPLSPRVTRAWSRPGEVRGRKLGGVPSQITMSRCLGVRFSSPSLAQRRPQARSMGLLRAEPPQQEAAPRQRLTLRHRCRSQARNSQSRNHNVIPGPENSTVGNTKE